MIIKTSIRYIYKHPVRAKWNEEISTWLYVSTDVISALIESKNPRKYWNTFKSRHKEILPYCKQIKVRSKDNKMYLTDCLEQSGINAMLLLLPVKNKIEFNDWIKGLSDPMDEQSKRNAYELYDNTILTDIVPGSISGLQQIHGFLFGGLYDFAGKIRQVNISKNGFVFANCMLFDTIFPYIESLPDYTLDEIIDKYIELNIVHPFMEGNGRATKIWLDVLCKNRLNLCIDWQKIDKKDYLSAMVKSPIDSEPIKNLIKNALTDQIDSREIFMKGIDYSYYYETIEE